ncbi:hypothetical protein BCR32DRAFT_243020 [Anaeromyces robustus]|uniref:TLDc domain-containing protein n=1 Tax=Anaeromyces robustus TaxID=1754192 RepID=A0A1Y1XDU8_9FUNG|nr:hypothetical protein BCR32DRAFT_243020 [Anaeromyces robustus]|eukprot:ORX83887.1 hypothetical protein BCR32DRAFT_243020 [Anaeromyces robustus]
MNKYYKFFDSPEDIALNIYELYKKKLITLECDKLSFIYLIIKWQFNSQKLETKIKIIGKETNKELQIIQLTNIVSQLQIELKEKDNKLNNLITYLEFESTIFCKFSRYEFILNQIKSSTNRNPLSLSLLYRASRDGDDFDTIKNRVYNRKNIVVLIENEEGYLFGGYTSYQFEECEDYDEYTVTDSTAFLFNIVNSTVYPIKDVKNALQFTRDKVFMFGEGDICVYKNFKRNYYNSGSSVQQSYDYTGKDYPDCFCGDENYRINDIEVYQCNFSS